MSEIIYVVYVKDLRTGVERHLDVCDDINEAADYVDALNYEYAQSGLPCNAFYVVHIYDDED